VGFYLIENTFTIKPDVISGNGNLGIVMIILFSPIFIVSYFLTFKLVREKSSNVKNRKISIGILLFSLVFCALLILAMINYATDLVTSLGGTPTNPESKIYRFGLV
jgi:dipeptide/tripeptide permease